MFLPSTLRKWSLRLLWAAWAVFFAVYAAPFGTAWLAEQGAFDNPQTQVDLVGRSLINWLLAVRIVLVDPRVLAPVLLTLAAVTSFTLGIWLHALIRRQEQSVVDVSRNEQVETLASQVRELRDAFEKYVRPRELTEQHMNAIEQFLIVRPRHQVQILFEHPNAEAGRFAGQIHRALQRAHWDAHLKARASQEPPISDGLHLRVTYQTGVEQQRIAKSAMDDLSRSFESVGISFSSSGSSTVQEKKDMEILMTVGHRPRV